MTQRPSHWQAIVTLLAALAAGAALLALGEPAHAAPALPSTLCF